MLPFHPGTQSAPNSCHYPSPQPREEPLILSLRSEAVGASSPGKGSSCSMFSLWLLLAPRLSFPRGQAWSPLSFPKRPASPHATACLGQRDQPHRFTRTWGGYSNGSPSSAASTSGCFPPRLSPEPVSQAVSLADRCCPCTHHPHCAQPSSGLQA